MTYRRSTFNQGSASRLAAFINRLHRENKLYRFFPDTTGTELIRAASKAEHVGTFLLEHSEQIIAAVTVEELWKEGRIAVFSCVEMGPRQRNPFWVHLGKPLMRVFCRSSFDRLETKPATWLGRGSALLGRYGFRMAPGPDATMTNYLPAILRHPATRMFFQHCDFLDCLRVDNGCSGILTGRENVKLVKYFWSTDDAMLQVLVDSERHQIALIDRQDWSACCYTASESPFQIHYRIGNKMGTSETVRIQRAGGKAGRSQTYTLLPNRHVEGDIFVMDRPNQRYDGVPTNQEVEILVEVGGEEVPFSLRRFRQDATRNKHRHMDGRRQTGLRDSGHESTAFEFARRST